MSNLWRIPTLEEANQYVRNLEEEKAVLAARGAENERRHKAWLASPEYKAQQRARKKEAKRREIEAKRLADELLARKAEEKANRIARQNEEQVRRAAYFAGPEYNDMMRAKEALEKAKRQAREAEDRAHEAAKIKRMLAWVAKVAEQLQRKPVDAERDAERVRRSRIKWENLIDDERVVGLQMFWERRATALAMHEANIPRKEIAKRFGVSVARMRQLHASALKDVGKPSPAEVYLDKQQTLEPAKYGSYTLRKMRVGLEPFMFQPKRDWLIVGMEYADHG